MEGRKKKVDEREGRLHDWKCDGGSVMAEVGWI